MLLIKESLVELQARDRAKEILDKGTFKEIVGSFDGLESPHLVSQGIVPQSDDGVVVARGTIAGESAVVVSIEGNFQGGGIGEVSGAKIAGAFELALRDNENGIRTRPVLLFDTGGVRLQEANYGLLAISEICSAIISLREYVPVVGVIPGKIGTYGGMSITAGLCSTLIMTKGARLSLNGPEVIEQEAGIEEFDSTDRRLIWNTSGGIQRFETEFVDHLVEDDAKVIRELVQDVFAKGNKNMYRSSQVERFNTILRNFDPSQRLSPIEAKRLIKESNENVSFTNKNDTVEKETESRGEKWFKTLTGVSESTKNDVPSVLCWDTNVGDERIRYISVVPNPNSRFPRARKGEVGLEEGWMIAKYVHEAIKEDEGSQPRAIIPIVDVPSQAYGYNEELFGIHQACAAAVDAYATARLNGHPVITLIVGNAISGAFLSHGMQANRILALDDSGVNVHVMSKKSAARITLRTIEELEEATKKTPAMAYDIHSFKTLGALHELIHGVNAENPVETDRNIILDKLQEAIQEVRGGSYDLSHRLQSEEAKINRSASIEVRGKLAEQWT